MFAYYVNLALGSFKRNKIITMLMVLAIALGIGSTMTTLTVFQVLSADPIPQKSERLFHVQLDASPPRGYQDGEEPPNLLTRYDAESLLQQSIGMRQALMTGGSGAIQPESQTTRPFHARLRYTSSDFFPMFETPFLYGNGWADHDDDRRTRVAVIAKHLNDTLFQGADSTGNTLLVDGHALRIVGVLDDWAPNPKFYDPTTGHYGSEELVFLPFSVFLDLGLKHDGQMFCFTPETEPMSLNSKCSWIQYWVELEQSGSARRYFDYLTSYSEEQRINGRFERPPNARLRNVTEWLDYINVVPNDVRLQMWIAMGFLLVCLVNTVGLLLAKFMRNAHEIGLRRALGASRRTIFHQHLVESGAIGIAGGVLGLCLALAGLWAVRQQPTSYAHLAHLDLRMLTFTFALALIASLLAGLIPAWRASQVAPAIQLKSQ